LFRKAIDPEVPLYISKPSRTIWAWFGENLGLEVLTPAGGTVILSAFVVIREEQSAMRAVVQRVSRACVTVEGRVIGQIGVGLLVLLGVAPDDTAADALWLAEKIAGLRIFRDHDGKMNRNLDDVQGSVLVVSQFTLYADCSRGKRPSFIGAARPEIAVPLYDKFIEGLRASGIRVETGAFGADMDVELVNQGPVTLIIDSKKT
jgi:D-tyrosyl-tRNA(Tyr) deacylase